MRGGLTLRLAERIHASPGAVGRLLRGAMQAWLCHLHQLTTLGIRECSFGGMAMAELVPLRPARD